MGRAKLQTPASEQRAGRGHRPLGNLRRIHLPNPDELLIIANFLIL